ncbi:MAG: FAD-binding monooxygenase [Shinella sp.]|nr:MAG: FAD-binding monooxygenase [Shinella sp.]
MSKTIYDVIIIGYGPVGATLANLLGQRGHRVAIADIHREVYDLPRAINIDQEVLRCWQRIGLANEIASGCEPHTGTDFVGVDRELIKYIYSAPPPYPLGWPANLMFIQPEAERVLRRGVQRFSNVTEYLGHEAVELRQSSDDVTVALKGEDGQFEITGRWLIGCDGANSPVRRTLGIDQRDLGFSEWYVVADAWLKQATPLPPRTTQFCVPEAPTSYVVCSGNLRRWEMKILPDEDPEIYRDRDQVKRRMAPFVDPEALEFWRSAVYHFHAKVTESWKKGRVFLAGDAAHQMPPFLGQGLCSGIRDAANLWWKLDRVLQGVSPEALLESYEQERKPHIVVLTEITKGLGEIVGETDREKAEARDRTLRKEMADGRMETVRQNLIPPLTGGFLDAGDASGLAGTLAIQPLLGTGSEDVLSDTLADSGMVLLAAAPIDPVTRSAFEAIGGTILIISSQHLQDVQGTFQSYVDRHGLVGLVVRPDGYVWSGQKDAESLHQAVLRLVSSISVEKV